MGGWWECGGAEKAEVDEEDVGIPLEAEEREEEKEGEWAEEIPEEEAEEVKEPGLTSV